MNIFDNNDIVYEILRHSSFKAVLNILEVLKPRKLIYHLLPEICKNKNRYEFVDGLVIQNELLLAKSVIDIVNPRCYPPSYSKTI